MAASIITILPSGEKKTFPSGTLLSDALTDMGVFFRTPCGGKGICGKCRIRIQKPLASRDESHKGSVQDVLACRTVIDKDCTVLMDRVDICPEIPVSVSIADTHITAAVDIGTTSVKLSLPDRANGVYHEICSFLNPQRRFGHDVISRIAAAEDLSIRAAQTRLVRNAIRTCLERIFQAHGVDGSRLDAIAFSGNTTMLYLLIGLDVESLGKYPYHAAIRDFHEQAETLKLSGFPFRKVMAMPVLSAFIGGDLIGSLACCQKAGLHRNVFFIDLGTNGELFLLDKEGRIFTTSCAMGPALEGMNISWGMTAEEGAITHIQAHRDILDYSMIGRSDPVGITGTALIDLLSILLDRGIVESSGAFSSKISTMSLPSPIHPTVRDGSGEIELWGGIRITRKDIRNVQLAKAASLTASQMLLQASGCVAEDIEHVLISGTLGQHLDMQSFKRIGFIPEFPNAAYKYLGNTSLMAAESACMDSEFMKRAALLRDRAGEIMLSTNPLFRKMFLQSLHFPAEGRGNG
jgi:uncharacterized 2Fe-2S/4Fe-4S cluster protein (DUF4445 family)